MGGRGALGDVRPLRDEPRRGTEAEYRRAFTKAVRPRLPVLADEFEAQTDTGR